MIIIKKKNKRHFIQLAFAVLTNGYIIGFFSGKIFQGSSKYMCVPGLNCYSCPGALGSCPIGSLQAVLSRSGNYVSYYVLGLLILFGVTMGRLVCGFLCPFGLVQDMLHKIKVPKLKVPKKPDKVLRYLKYVIFALFVVLFPMFLTDSFGLGGPYFCKWICPSGTLFAGIPLISLNENLRSFLGGLFFWKMSILLLVIGLSVVIYRPFCKYLCPLGAFYALFNKISIYKLNLDKHKCVGCNQCNKACKMNITVTEDINSPECIRCGDCKNACNFGAISTKCELLGKKLEKPAKETEKTNS